MFRASGLLKGFGKLIYTRYKHINDNCVINKMLEYDWFLRAPIYGLIGCFSSELSDYKHL